MSDTAQIERIISEVNDLEEKEKLLFFPQNRRNFR